MAHNSGLVEVRRSRGKLVVNGIGRTPRGQKFIAEQVALKSHDMSSEGFKKEMAAAVEKILGSEA